MSHAKIAIATRNIETYSETFVRRHVFELYGGKTVVIGVQRAPAKFTDRPHFLYPTRRIPPKLPRNIFSAIARILAFQSDFRARDRTLVAFLRDHGVTTVLCEFGFIATELARPLHDAGVDVFVYFRGNDASRRLTDSRYVKKLSEVFPLLTGTVAVSRFLFENLDRHGLKHDNRIVIPSGTDCRKISPGAPLGQQIVTVGRLVEKKDPFTALEAFARIAPDTAANWIMIGSGRLEKEFREKVREMGLEDRVQMLGALPHEETLRHLEAAAVSFQPYRTAYNGDTEGMPSILQEAMAAGRPIVTTAHAGIPEHLTHADTALLYPEGDVDGLAGGLRQALQGGPKMVEMGRRARAYAEENLDYRGLYTRLESFIDASRNRQSGHG